MYHLVRIGAKMYMLPEAELWRASADYGEMTDNDLAAFGIESTKESGWPSAVALWLQGKGF